MIKADDENDLLYVNSIGENDPLYESDFIPSVMLIIVIRRKCHRRKVTLEAV